MSAPARPRPSPWAFRRDAIGSGDETEPARESRQLALSASAPLARHEEYTRFRLALLDPPLALTGPAKEVHVVEPYLGDGDRVAERERVVSSMDEPNAYVGVVRVRTPVDPCSRRRFAPRTIRLASTRLRRQRVRLPVKCGEFIDGLLLPAWSIRRDK
jgi:hypothetical protein